MFALASSRIASVLLAILPVVAAASPATAQSPAKSPTPLAMHSLHISADRSVKYDYDLVYVRAPRFGDKQATRWAEVFDPLSVDPGTDLMLLHPDGREEVLVAGGEGAVADPVLSFDAQWVYYARFHNQTKQAPWGSPLGGSDLYKIHLATRKIVRLTHQERTPNTGILTDEEAKAMPVFNLGPCPAPGGRVIFTSNRNLFEAPKMYTRGSFQLFAMDEDGANVELIGHLNIASALHPVILRDGRVMFSSYESQGLRDLRNWALWFIYPDGTGWGPIVSGFQRAEVYHFHTQLSGGSIVVEAYYNLNNFGFGTFFKLPATPTEGYAAFGPADRYDSRNPEQADPRRMRFSFTPHGLESLTRFASSFDAPAALSDTSNSGSPRVGKFTHPSGAPDNHLLAVWSPGAVNKNGSYQKDWHPFIDSGLYLIKNGDPIDEPGQMLLIKNDPKFNEQWPRAVVPYERIYGVAEPAAKAPPANNGAASPQLDAGAPFGLVGTSSLYKRETMTGGAVAKGGVTAVYAHAEKYPDKLQGRRPFNYYVPEIDHWFSQGSDCGLYDNSDIHAIRIVAQEPASQQKRKFWNWGDERYRVLGEVPVRKFRPDGSQPTDPDQNSDTSFLARIPADTSFTFQMLDKHGLMLTMAQTWHQVRPGEIRHDCGGCHAHSQPPTEFPRTAAARPDYQVFDMAMKTPLLTNKAQDQSGRQWDAANETGLRFSDDGPVNVEFYRHVVPIFRRSCGGCHSKDNPQPAARLVLDDLELVPTHGGGGMFREVPGGKVPASYAMLARSAVDRYGHNPIGKNGWVLPQVSRYVRVYQARRSLLAWKVLGQRTDGWSNDDFPTPQVPDDPSTLELVGQPVEASVNNVAAADVDLTGSIMPPPEAVKAGKVQPLSDEDRRTIFRWIDLGCPLDLDFDPSDPEKNGPGSGWMDDETRPTLTVALPRAGRNDRMDRILIGMHDYYTGLNMDSFTVTADFPVTDTEVGRNLAEKFRRTSPGVWELPLGQPLVQLRRGTLTVSIKDKQGNLTRVERTFSVSK